MAGASVPCGDDIAGAGSVAAGPQAVKARVKTMPKIRNNFIVRDIFLFSF
jgi:hypothetical protein